MRHDGALLLSLNDADGRDLTGLKVVSFVFLGDADADLARKIIEDTMYFAAARAVARLPKITTKGGAERAARKYAPSGARYCGAAPPWA